MRVTPSCYWSGPGSVNKRGLHTQRTCTCACHLSLQSACGVPKSCPQLSRKIKSCLLLSRKIKSTQVTLLNLSWGHFCKSWIQFLTWSILCFINFFGVHWTLLYFRLIWLIKKYRLVWNSHLDSQSTCTSSLLLQIKRFFFFVQGFVHLNALDSHLYHA